MRGGVPIASKKELSGPEAGDIREEGLVEGFDLSAGKAMVPIDSSEVQAPEGDPEPFSFGRGVAAGRDGRVIAVDKAGHPARGSGVGGMAFTTGLGGLVEEGPAVPDEGS